MKNSNSNIRDINRGLSLAFALAIILGAIALSGCGKDKVIPNSSEVTSMSEAPKKQIEPVTESAKSSESKSEPASSSEAPLVSSNGIPASSSAASANSDSSSSVAVHTAPETSSAVSEVSSSEESSSSEGSSKANTSDNIKPKVDNADESRWVKVEEGDTIEQDVANGRYTGYIVTDGDFDGNAYYGGEVSQISEEEYQKKIAELNRYYAEHGVAN